MEELSIRSLWNTLYRFVQRLIGQVFFFLMKDSCPWIEEITMKLPNTLVCQCASHTQGRRWSPPRPLSHSVFLFSSSRYSSALPLICRRCTPRVTSGRGEHAFVEQPHSKYFNQPLLKVSPEKAAVQLVASRLLIVSVWFLLKPPTLMSAGRATTVRSSPWVVLLHKKSTTSARCQRPEQAWVCFSSLGRGKFSLQTSQCLTQRCLVMPTVPQAWSLSARMEMESTRWLQSFIVLAGAQRSSRLSTERWRLFSQRPQSGAATSLQWAEPGMSNDHHHEFMEKQRKWVIADSLSGSFFFF